MYSIKQTLISAIQEEVKLTGFKQSGTLGTSAAERDSESLLLPQNVDEIWLLKSSLCRSRLPHEAVALIRLEVGESCAAAGLGGELIALEGMRKGRKMGNVAQLGK